MEEAKVIITPGEKGYNETLEAIKAGTPIVIWATDSCCATQEPDEELENRLVEKGTLAFWMNDCGCSNELKRKMEIYAPKFLFPGPENYGRPELRLYLFDHGTCLEDRDNLEKLTTENKIYAQVLEELEEGHEYAPQFDRDRIIKAVWHDLAGEHYQKIREIENMQDITRILERQELFKQLTTDYGTVKRVIDRLARFDEGLTPEARPRIMRRDDVDAFMG